MINCVSDYYSDVINGGYSLGLGETATALVGGILYFLYGVQWNI